MNARAITLDIDWAPDYMIDATAELLLAQRVAATWFVTHESPAVQRLRETPELFELGIHPNFLSGSSHGATPRAVLDHCMELLPEATCMRSHALVQSTPILELVAAETPVRSDVSILLPGARHLHPVTFTLTRGRLLRIPYFWEDDVEMMGGTDWSGSGSREYPDGLLIFDYHPVHVFLNSSSLEVYEHLKERGLHKGGVSTEDVGRLVERGRGAGTHFRELVGSLGQAGDALRIMDIEARWAARDGNQAA